MNISDTHCIELKNKTVENCRNTVTAMYNEQHKKLSEQYTNDLMDWANAMSAAMDECMNDYYICLLDSGIAAAAGGLQLLTQEQQEALNACNEKLTQCNDDVSLDFSNELKRIIEEYNRQQNLLFFRLLDNSNSSSEINNCHRKGRSVYEDCVKRTVGPVQGDLGTRLIDSIYNAADTLLRGGSEVIDSIPRLPRDKQ